MTDAVQNQSLGDIIDFINKLKTLSFRDATSLCCAKVVDMANSCIWDTCISWKQFLSILTDLKSAYAADDLGPLIVAMLGLLEINFGWRGAAAAGNNFTTSLPVFWAMFGAFAGVVVGSLAGAWVGLQVINATVRTSFWAGKTDVFRASYYVGYGGGSGVVAGLLGFLETSWVVSYLVLAISLVAVPYYILAELGKYLNDVLNNATDKVAATYRLLGHGFLMAFGSWASAWALQLSIQRLLQWFDKQDARPSDTNSGITNDTALAYDFVNHSLITFAYNTLAWVIAGCTWGYVYYQLTDTTLKN